MPLPHCPRQTYTATQIYNVGRSDRLDSVFHGYQQFAIDVLTLGLLLGHRHSPTRHTIFRYAGALRWT